MVLALALRLDLASLFLGRAAVMTEDLGTTTPWQAAYVFFLGAGICMFLSAGFLFILCLFQAMFRRVWVARFLLFLIMFPRRTRLLRRPVGGRFYTSLGGKPLFGKALLDD